MMSFCHLLRRFATSSQHSKQSVILGVKTKKKSDDAVDNGPDVSHPTGTSNFKKYDQMLEGRLSDLLKASRPLKCGQARTFYDVHADYGPVIVVGIGSDEMKVNDLECLDEKQELVRRAIGAGFNQLKESGIDQVVVDTMGHPCAAAEGAILSTWSYKEKDRKKFPNIIKPIEDENASSLLTEWKCGEIYGQAQNWARHLMDSPANLMNPTHFANEVEAMLNNCESEGTIRVLVHEKDWISQENMGAFLSVAQGSDQDPKFVEVHYDGPDVESNERPLVLVGKGVTFDSGGVSIKPSQGMEEMRGDMGGAATIVAAISACARLGCRGKIIGLFPLCENLINGKATKPGDVISAKNGVTIQVDNTDAEGRLLLADALSYAQQLRPRAVLDAATLTGAAAVALGSPASAAYTNNEELWRKLKMAGNITGDRLWRMPLFDHYSNQVKPSHLADISNVGKEGRYGGSCTAAAFLRHFVDSGTDWIHLDIAGVMMSNGTDFPYLCRGMSGRPTRTITQFVRDYYT